jgi:signal transduction histidine kinase
MQSDGTTPSAARSLALTMLSATDLPELEQDEARIRQVIGNLLANALRFTPAGGSVTVEAVATPGGGVEVSVRDSGPGIAADVLPHVFDRFYRSGDSPGSGLGLPIARSLVEAHGGRIEAESPPSGGTLMRIRLPAVGGDRTALDNG